MPSLTNRALIAHGEVETPGIGARPIEANHGALRAIAGNNGGTCQPLQAQCRELKESSVCAPRRDKARQAAPSSYRTMARF